MGWYSKPTTEAAANEAERVKHIEDQITPILGWTFEARLMLMRHLRLEPDMEHISTQLRDLEDRIARERKKK